MQDSEKERDIGVVSEQVRVAESGAIFSIGVNDYDGDAAYRRVLVKARHEVLEGWHFLFSQNQVNRLRVRELERFCIISRLNNAVPLTLNRFPHAGTYPVNVLDDEDRRNLPRIFHLKTLSHTHGDARSLPCFYRDGALLSVLSRT